MVGVFKSRKRCVCRLKLSVWVTGLLGSQNSEPLRPSTPTILLQPRVQPGSQWLRRPCALAEQVDSGAPHRPEDSFLEPSEGSHQGWGLWVNESVKKSRVCWEGWTETGLGQGELKQSGAPVRAQAAGAQSWRGIWLDGVVKPGHRCQKVVVLCIRPV